MNYHSRRNCLALLALLLLSHAALTLHVATHIPADQAKCEYCAGHANPAHALVAAHSDLPRLVTQSTEFEHAATVLRKARPVHYRERAPPVVV
jgi:hypothetical protein